MGVYPRSWLKVGAGIGRAIQHAVPEGHAVAVAGRADIDRWFGGSPPNFGTLDLGHIEVDSADSWTNRWLSSISRSTADSLASNRSHARTLKSGGRFDVRAGRGDALRAAQRPRALRARHRPDRRPRRGGRPPARARALGDLPGCRHGPPRRRVRPPGVRRVRPLGPRRGAGRRRAAARGPGGVHGRAGRRPRRPVAVPRGVAADPQPPVEPRAPAPRRRRARRRGTRARHAQLQRLRSRPVATRFG